MRSDAVQKAFCCSACRRTVGPVVGAVLFLVVSILAAPAVAVGNDGGENFVERIVAVVNDEPIFLTEMNSATGCLRRAGVSAEDSTVLRILILRRIILLESLRLRIVDNISAEGNISDVIRLYIETVVKPFIGFGDEGILDGTRGEETGPGNEGSGTVGEIPDPKLVDTLWGKLSELWGVFNIRVLPGPWGKDLAPPDKDDVRCLLIASEAERFDFP